MKTEIKKLDSLSHNDTAATKLINDNFAALQQGIEDSLSRSGKTPNFMDTTLDMNSRRVINTGDPVDETDAVNYGTYKKHIDQAIDAAQRAAVSANNSQNSAVEARQYARQAKTSRDEAVAAAEEAKETVENGIQELNSIVTDGKTDLDNIVNEGVVEISDTIDAGKEDLNDIIGSINVDNYYTKAQVDAKIDAIDVDDKTSTWLEIDFYTNNWVARNNYTGEYTYENTTEFDPPIEAAYKYSGAVLTFSESDAISGKFSPVFKWIQKNNNRVMSATIYSKEPINDIVTVNIIFIR